MRKVIPRAGSVWGVGAYYLGANYHRVLGDLRRVVAHGWWVTGLLLGVLFFWLMRSGGRTRS